MGDTALLDGLKRQFGEAFDVLAAAVGTFTDEQWAQGGSPYVGAGRAAAHALVCAEFYTCRERACLDHFGTPIWEMADADVPDQATQAGYLAECKARTMAWIDGLGPRHRARAARRRSCGSPGPTSSGWWAPTPPRSRAQRG